MSNCATIAKDSARNGKSFVSRGRFADKPTADRPKPMSAKSTLTRPIIVWLIEDNHSFRHTIVRVLNQAQDLECVHDFASSEEALDELARGAVPDVVLLDVELPGLNGLEAVKRIKSIAPSSRVIMLTVFDDDDQIMKARFSRASGSVLRAAP